MPSRVIHWNCQGAFRHKAAYIFKLCPDILVISECESIEKLKIDDWDLKPYFTHWYGDNPHKGIAIFVFIPAEVSVVKEYSSRYRYIIPYRIQLDTVAFVLFAVWAMADSKQRNYSYTGQIIQAVSHYDFLLSEANIWIGDFNSNKFWDRKGKFANHMHLVHMLEKYNIQSLYHRKYNESPGEEIRPTFYLYRNKDKPYHLDYCFCSELLLGTSYDFIVGSFEDWIHLSDHSPIIADIL